MAVKFNTQKYSLSAKNSAIRGVFFSPFVLFFFLAFIYKTATRGAKEQRDTESANFTNLNSRFFILRTGLTLLRPVNWFLVGV